VKLPGFHKLITSDITVGLLQCLSSLGHETAPGLTSWIFTFFVFL